MLEAIRGAIEKAPERKELRITLFDALDLFKLTPEELAEFDVDPGRGRDGLRRFGPGEAR